MVRLLSLAVLSLGFLASLVAAQRQGENDRHPNKVRRIRFSVPTSAPRIHAADVRIEVRADEMFFVAYESEEDFSSERILVLADVGSTIRHLPCHALRSSSRTAEVALSIPPELVGSTIHLKVFNVTREGTDPDRWTLDSIEVAVVK